VFGIYFSFIRVRDRCGDCGRWRW